MNYEVKVLSSAAKKFWKTKKQKAIIKTTTDPIPLNMGYWDGGSKDEYFAVYKNGTVKPLRAPGCPAFDSSPVPSIAPTDDMAIVIGGWFCGKVATLKIHVTSLEGWIW